MAIPKSYARMRISACSLLLALAIAGLTTAVAQPATPVRRTVQHVILEGGGPDQGPGGDVAANMRALSKRFGAMPADSGRQLGYGVQQLRILSRSSSVVRRDVEQALNLAEETGIPIFLHVDSCYGWGADSAHGQDAPHTKFWEHAEMREWDRFPTDGRLPDRVPRAWLQWGPWCSPAPAVPAFGSPKFVDFAVSQLDQGVLAPLVKRLQRWEQSGRRHLFAGINVAWEAHLPNYGDAAMNQAIRQAGGIVRAEYPRAVRGLRMEPEFIGRQLGYASLHWRGWNEDKLAASAANEGVGREEKFRQLCYASLRDYMESLAKACHERGLSADEVYTHIVALASVGESGTTRPPIWTAVNRYATPGFTMDNRGGAKFDLKKLIEQIQKADGSRGPQFGVVETYFRLGERNYVKDAISCRQELEAMFAAGAKVQVFYGGFPLESDRLPADALVALHQWLSAAPR